MPFRASVQVKVKNKLLIAFLHIRFIKENAVGREIIAFG